jgi:hypothetical protein
MITLVFITGYGFESSFGQHNNLMSPYHTEETDPRKVDLNITDRD